MGHYSMSIFCSKFWVEDLRMPWAQDGLACTFLRFTFRVWSYRSSKFNFRSRGETNAHVNVLGEFSSIFTAFVIEAFLLEYETEDGEAIESRLETRIKELNLNFESSNEYIYKFDNLFKHDWPLIYETVESTKATRTCRGGRRSGDS